MNDSKKITLISHNDSNGGAARAVNRLFECLISNNNQVKLMLMKKSDNRNGIVEVNFFKRIFGHILSRLDIKICNFLIPESREWKTGAFFGVLSARNINKSDADAINLHWLGHGLISLRQLRKIKKPIIWTLHDEWALQPITHYSVGVVTIKRSNLLQKYISKFVIWNRTKQKRNFILNKNVNLVALNNEMKSRLVLRYPEKINKVFRIANPVDLAIFNPSNRNYFAESLNLARDKPTLLFLGGTGDIRKGWDLLENSLQFTKSSFNLIVIGGKDRKIISSDREIDIVGIEAISNLSDLIDLYIASSAVIVPSRAEGLPQTATESISCGTPVIGFKIGGLIDIVINEKTGYVVEPFNIQELGLAIDKSISANKDFFKNNCRSFAEKEFACSVVSSKYNSII
jgi:glycosyltransferase involved in cell wall biosynthesis